MDSTIKQTTVGRFLSVLSLGWRITLLMVKYAVIKRKNVKLSAYQEDVFFYWIWRWKWQWNFAQQQWTVRQLRAYCPICQSKLATIKTNHSSVLICPKGGGKHGDLFTYEKDVVNTIKSLILERATGQFKLNEP